MLSDRIGVDLEPFEKPFLTNTEGPYSNPLVELWQRVGVIEVMV